jgi:hypothetical protein
MNTADRLILIFAAVYAFIGNQNAVEAHRHAHELACHVGAEELCEYHAP